MGVFPPVGTAPTIQTPSFFNSSSAWTRFVSRATGTSSAAPMADLAAAPVRPDRVVLGHDHPVNPGGLGRSEHRPEVPGVLDLVERQEERRAPRVRPGSSAGPRGEAVLAPATRATTPW